MELDRLDAEILRLLTRDARLSYREVARRLGTTTPTVSARVKRLEELGLIRGYHALVDETTLGEHVALLTLTPVEKDGGEALARALGGLPHAREVYLLERGRVFCKVAAPSAHELEETLDKIETLPGAKRAQVQRVSGVAAKGAALLGRAQARVNLVCHECRGPVHGEGAHARLAGRPHVFCCGTCRSTFTARFERLKAKSR